MNIFISKYKSDGSKEWTNCLAHLRRIVVFSSTASDGSIYISGITRGIWMDKPTAASGCFVSKYNSDGSKAWTRLIGTPTNDIAYSLELPTTDQSMPRVLQRIKTEARFRLYH